ncbi:hypothetical protein ACFOKI_02885 [Sphingomonas qilianensis]|uniref:Uncharacterized protein n=1 Tax=Sphingomonas qilianensis TaxID=1736690 RepID=A0ABU9XVJ3_9SPHN
MPRLTEANYTSRRIKLVASLDTARTANNEAAFRREMDEATDEDVKAAREAVVDLESRITGLDMAWSRTLDERAAEGAAVRSQAAKAAHAKMEVAMARRAEVATEMQTAAEVLASLYRDYQTLGRNMLHGALAHKEAFTGAGLQHLRELIDGTFNDVRNPLGRVLYNNGLDFTGIAVKGFSTDNLVLRCLPSFIAWQNKRVAGHVQALAQVGEA